MDPYTQGFSDREIDVLLENLNKSVAVDCGRIGNYIGKLRGKGDELGIKLREYKFRLGTFSKTEVDQILGDGNAFLVWVAAIDNNNHSIPHICNLGLMNGGYVSLSNKGRSVYLKDGGTLTGWEVRKIK